MQKEFLIHYVKNRIKAYPAEFNHHSVGWIMLGGEKLITFCTNNFSRLCSVS